jgi:hypothetical protein
VIPYINRINFALGGSDPGLQLARPAFDLPERSYGQAARVENRRLIAFSRERFLPCSQQGVVRFHPLRASRSAPKFATRFQK